MRYRWTRPFGRHSQTIDSPNPVPRHEAHPQVLAALLIAGSGRFWAPTRRKDALL